MSSDIPTPDFAFEAYRHLVEDTEQAAPVLLFASQTEVVTALVDGFENGGSQQALDRTITVLKQELGPARWLVFSVESWLKKIRTDEATDLRPGDLAKLRDRGDGDVKECVSITAASAAGEGWTYIREFERGPEGVTWGESQIMNATETQGGIFNILLHAVR